MRGLRLIYIFTLFALTGYFILVLRFFYIRTHAQGLYRGYLYDSNVFPVSRDADAWPSKQNMNSSSQVFPLRYNEPRNITACEPRKHIVYLKTTKCFSTTFHHIMKRFALKYDLNILKPKAKGHFYPTKPLRPRRITKEDALYKPRMTYDMIVDHMVFDYDVVSSMMPSDSFYVGVVREPFSQFTSAYNSFSLWTKFNVQIDEFLSAPEAYWKQHVRQRDRATYARNSMMAEFGFPDEREDLRDNEPFIEHYVHYLDSKFDFVLVTEYFDESLIYLRRLLCWEMENVLYVPGNVGSYTFEPKTVAKSSFLLTHQKWSKADYYLYRHFLAKFKETLKHQGQDFFDEVEIFRKALSKINKCGGVEYVKINGTGSRGRTYSRHTKINCIPGGIFIPISST
ncbi:galactosylceramide sulfotransferase [Lingula anatina]|uniref:Galactosylceramide sulfotransferase n=1 Tax=Lingula anatina TaxID=7574 RepID=A0A1S3J5I8_LINAN|nr:galactosylceramide sulfotransferase [Lingula anatina]|eukprot:XP_013405655.1 galactosylceramide sulfotransferase [Lingula anatina]